MIPRHWLPVIYGLLLYAMLWLLSGCDEKKQVSIVKEAPSSPTENAPATPPTTYWDSLGEDVLSLAGDSALIITSPGEWTLYDILPQGFEDGVVIDAYFSPVDWAPFMVIPKYQDTTIGVFYYKHSSADTFFSLNAPIPSGSHPVYDHTTFVQEEVSNPLFLLLPHQYNNQMGMGVKATWPEGEAVFYFGCYEEHNEKAVQIQSPSLEFPLSLPPFSENREWLRHWPDDSQDSQSLAMVFNYGKFMDLWGYETPLGNPERFDADRVYQYTIIPRYYESTVRLYQEIEGKRTLLEQGNWIDRAYNPIAIPLPSKENGTFWLTVDYGGEHGEFAFALDESQSPAGGMDRVSYQLSSTNLGYYTTSLADPGKVGERRIIAYNSRYRLIAYSPDYPEILLGNLYGMGGESLAMDPATFDLETGELREYPLAKLNSYHWGPRMDSSRILQNVDHHLVEENGSYQEEYAVHIFDLSAGELQFIPLTGPSGDVLIPEENSSFSRYPRTLDTIYDPNRQEFLWFYTQAFQDLPTLTELYCARISREGRVLDNHATDILFDNISIGWGIGNRPTRFVLDNGTVYFPSVLIEYDEDGVENKRVGPTTLVAYEPLSGQYRRTVVYDGQQRYSKYDDYNEQGRNIRLIAYDTLYFVANHINCYAIRKQTGEVIAQFSTGEDGEKILEAYVIPGSGDLLLVYEDGCLYRHDADTLEQDGLVLQLEEDETFAGIDGEGNLLILFNESER